MKTKFLDFIDQFGVVFFWLGIFLLLPFAGLLDAMAKTRSFSWELVAILIFLAVGSVSLMLGGMDLVYREDNRRWRKNHPS